jgi:hypothetical protein
MTPVRQPRTASSSFISPARNTHGKQDRTTTPAATKAENGEKDPGLERLVLLATRTYRFPSTETHLCATPILRRQEVTTPR